MRRAKEISVWGELQIAHGRTPADDFPIGSTSLDLAQPCTVLGGKNGSGKSRLLRSIEAHLGPQCLYLDLHHLCEQALIVLRALEDHLDEMKHELGRSGPDEARLDDVGRIVGRDYAAVDWYALDVGPAGEEVSAKFRWRGSEDDPRTPYFVATYAGVEYGALDMGLGEFSVHFLLWILEQFKDRRGLTLLLDEPDAYLPPVGVRALLARLLSICQKREWRMILSTHSEELISSAVDHSAFVLLRLGMDGMPDVSHSKHDQGVADELLATPAIERVLFVEDESASSLCRALLDEADRALSKRTSVVWGEGSGYMTPLRKKLPQSPALEVMFAMVPDGDQRTRIKGEPAPGQWPVHFLPTNDDPDQLFRSLRNDPAALADAFGVDQSELQRKLDSLQGEDPHDWVNLLGEAYGRPQVLRALAKRWAGTHQQEAAEFAAAIRAGT